MQKPGSSLGAGTRGSGAAECVRAHWRGPRWLGFARSVAPARLRPSCVRPEKPRASFVRSQGWSALMRIEAPSGSAQKASLAGCFGAIRETLSHVSKRFAYAGLGRPRETPQPPQLQPWRRSRREYGGVCDLADTSSGVHCRPLLESPRTQVVEASRGPSPIRPLKAPKTAAPPGRVAKRFECRWERRLEVRGVRARLHQGRRAQAQGSEAHRWLRTACRLDIPARRFEALLCDSASSGQPAPAPPRGGAYLRH